MDIFKAIFASDDEESDDEGEASGKIPDESPSTTSPLPPVGFDLQTTQTASSELPTVSRSLFSPDSVPQDPSTFRPKFIPKSQREGKPSKSSHSDSVKSKSDKARRSLVSFGMDADGEEGLNVVPDLKKRKKKDKDRDKTKKRAREGDDEEPEPKRQHAKIPAAPAREEEEEWIEKTPPPLIQSAMPLSLSVPSRPSATDGTTSSRARPKASDFM
jgi:G patch domain-containing protein 1